MSRALHLPVALAFVFQCMTVLPSSGQNITNVVNINISATTNRIFDAITNPNPPPIVLGTTNFYTFTVSTPLAVLDVDLRLSVLHSAIGDLDVFLISPTGVQMALTNYTILSGDDTGNNFQDTYIDEEGGVGRIGSGFNPALDLAPYAGPEYGGVRYKPALASDTLTKFNGLNPQGTWTLKIIDGITGDDGIVLWAGANPQQLDDTLNDSASQIGQSWGTNALGTQLIITTVVPEPQTLALLAMGLAGTALVARRFRRS